MTLNDFSNYSYKNDYQAIQRVKEYTKESEVFFWDENSDEIVLWWYKWVQKRAEILFQKAEKTANDNLSKELEEKVEFYSKKNEIQNDLNSAFFKLKIDKTEEWMCPWWCGYPYENCHC